MTVPEESLVVVPRMVRVHPALSITKIFSNNLGCKRSESVGWAIYVAAPPIFGSMEQKAEKPVLSTVWPASKLDE